MLIDEATHRTTTRADLANAITRAVGLSNSDAAAMVEIVIDEIMDALSRGEEVKLRSFGNFHVHAAPERPGRNPRTGEPYAITARRRVLFKASSVLESRINGEPKTLTAREWAAPSWKPVGGQR